MSCPTCGEPLPGGGQRCPVCDRPTPPLAEGSLAPDPFPEAPDESGRPEPLRDIPALRKKERTWKDEVRERVLRRRTERGALPPRRPSPAVQAKPATPALPAEPPGTDEAPSPHPVHVVTAKMEPEQLPDPALVADVSQGAAGPETRGNEPAEEWDFNLESVETDVRPPERPARPLERIQAAAIDTGVLVGLWAVVVYLASRAARVSIVGLLPVWPFLAGYLACLGLAYAGYFTGISGQTLGKVVTGLKVVTRAGRPPTFFQALLRTALGVVGLVAISAGSIPMLFDPARRAFHDRLLGTRVVRL